MKSPVLITGGHGFLGTILARDLSARGYRVYLGDFDITQPALVQKFSNQFPENSVVLHLAGIAGVLECERDPVVAHKVNGDGPVNVLKAFPKTPHFVFFSTGDVYKEKLEQAIREDDPIETHNAYTQSKRAAEVRLQSLAADTGTKLTILRLFKYVHKTQGKNTFMSRIYHDLLDMRPPGASTELRVGNLDLVRDLSGVQDLNRAINSLLEVGIPKKDLEIYNLASGKGKSLRQIVEKLADRVGVKPVICPDQSLFRQEPRIVVGDPTKFSLEFGWQPQATDEDRLIDLFVADFEKSPRPSKV